MSTRCKQKVAFPKPAKYWMRYQRRDGQEKMYLVSNPIEATPDTVTVYAFGSGVRSFIKDRIRRFSRVC